MLPLYLARIEDLGRGDLVKVDCAACHHVALLTPGALLKLGLSLQTKVLDLKERVRCRGCGARGRAVVSVKWRCQSTKPVPFPRSAGAALAVTASYVKEPRAYPPSKQTSLDHASPGDRGTKDSA
jgi:hypothetical protein